MNTQEPTDVPPASDPMCSEEAAERHEAVESQSRTDRTDELLERRGRALGSILTLAPDDFAKRYQALFQSALTTGGVDT